MHVDKLGLLAILAKFPSQEGESKYMQIYIYKQCMYTDRCVYIYIGIEKDKEVTHRISMSSGETIRFARGSHTFFWTPSKCRSLREAFRSTWWLPVRRRCSYTSGELRQCKHLFRTARHEPQSKPG